MSKAYSITTMSVANKPQHMNHMTIMSRTKAVVSMSARRRGTHQQSILCIAKREISSVTSDRLVGRYSWRAKMPIRQGRNVDTCTHRRMIAITSSASDFGSFSSSGSQADESSSESVSNYGQETFSRMNVRDPYRRLGVGKDATFDEIKEARNYLMEVRTC